MKKLIDKDPFSSGTEHMRFDDYNCSQCVKSSEPRDDGKGNVRYTNSRPDNMPKCGVQRDIMTRMVSSKPIREETVTICREFSMYGVLCPYMKTVYPKHNRKAKNDKTQLSLF